VPEFLIPLARDMPVSCQNERRKFNSGPAKETGNIKYQKQKTMKERDPIPLTFMV
jgi:hypothetical protein